MAINQTPEQYLKAIALKARDRRLDLKLTQQGLAERAGVSLSTLKKFERTGKIAFASLLKLALVLNSLEDFKALFAPNIKAVQSLDELLRKEKIRQRGRLK